MLTKKFHMSKLSLEKEKELEIKLPTFEKAKEFQGKKYICFIHVYIYTCIYIYIHLFHELG